MIDPKVVAAFERLYGKLPRLACKGLCSGSCGPIAASEFEVRRLEHETGRQLTFSAETLTCSMLTPDKKCRGYRSRPLICRLFGSVKKMACPYGCEPSRFLKDHEAKTLLQQANLLGGAEIIPVEKP